MNVAIIENLTDLPSERVVPTAAWVLRTLSIDRGDIFVRVRWTEKLCHLGALYPGRNGYRFYISARIPRVLPYECATRRRKGPPPMDLVTHEESLVCILAHEGTHAIQELRPRFQDGGYNRKPAQPHWRQTRLGPIWVKPKQDPVHVERPVFIEAEAEWAEHRMLELWRERG
jgi:hypothetical protein